ncbi:hypothetical protein NAEGRDRAFT_59848 [Naegleria gruberi]|uniref:Alpha-2-macroglobulin domain-containing protein n=1 Tax=Naegleria gruberi TaxID=5762 RepID=D2W1J8_NAEGR|nr:uncharacterized protein NAEGRDRAFT_59848 [Naegleria gruberi]EFC37102.1 hypothetical protein NAEGRDRAFT_59848 [Naegleria gruberi]|eukprot:XP_002669846.1 hypothetical protein NAEGRDRAFT_59848 [Naegleria gruberi strain NEG-M]
MKIEEEIDSELLDYQQLVLHVKKGDSKDVVSALIRENDDQQFASDHDEQASLENKIIDDSVFKIEDLDEESLENLLGELMKDQQDQEQSLQENYLIREQTLKPPEPGTFQVKNQIEFPPKSVNAVDEMVNSIGNQLAQNALEKKKEEKFRIVRAVPTGKQNSEVASVPFISITFSHDMIEEFDGETKSFEEIDFIEISPVTENVKEGKWKWIGTKSLVFQPRFRFDRSTEFSYKVIKEKTKSVHGHTLGDDLSATFKTPTARILSCIPSGNSFPISQLPFMFFQFDQDIDKQSVLEKLEMKVSSYKIGVELLEDTSIISKMLAETDYSKKFPYVYNLYYRSLKNVHDPKRCMWIKLLVANDTLHAGKNYRKIGLGEYLSVWLRPGFKSLEGPLVSTHETSTGVRGYSKMVVSDHYPKKHFFFNEIYPGCSFTFRFNNPIDLEKVDSIEKFVQLEPVLNNYKVKADGNTIIIAGDTLAREKYSVKILKGVPDIYNQIMESDYSATFEVSGEDREFNMTLPTFSVMPPCLFDNNEPFLYFDSVNIQETHVIINQVDPIEMYKECVYPKFAPKTFFNSYDNYAHFDWNPRKPHSFGKQVFDQKVQTENFVKDRTVSTKIMLPEFLQNGKTGSVLVHFKPKRSILYSLFSGYQARWVQVSNLCVDVVSIAGEKLGVFVTDFSTGKPVDNAEVTMFDTKNYYPDKETRTMDVRSVTEKTNERGMAYFTCIQGYHHVSIAVSKDTDQVVYTNPSVYVHSTRQDTNIAHIFNDRGLYKPNETVHIKGFIRNLIYDTNKDSENYGTYAITTQISKKEVTYEVFDNSRVKYLDGKVELSANGSFVLDLVIPDNVNLGSHSVTFSFDGQRFQQTVCWNHTFKVEEFRTREYTVSSSIIPSSEKVDLFVGEKFINKVSAKYYSGGGLSNSTVNYSLNTTSKNFTPEGWSNYIFQETDLRNNYKLDRLLNSVKSKTRLYSNINGTTDSNGDDHLSIILWDPEKLVTSPISVSCNANVQDINRQTQRTSSEVILHSCKYYIGVRCTKRVVMKSDENIDCFFVVTDIKGKVVKDVPISVKLVQFGYDSKGYEKWETTNPIKEIKLTSQDQPLLHTFKLSEENKDTAYGEYAILCEVKEDETPKHRSGINRCSIPIRKLGYREHLTSKGYASLNTSGIELITNKFENDEYQPGEDAKVYIVSPFSGDCTGVAWILCNRLIKQETFDISSDVGMYELTIPIKKEYRPNIQVKVQLVGKENYVDIDDMTRVNPTQASGSIDIQISKSSHELDVTVTPKDTILSPGKETSVTVLVKDKQGNTVPNSEVCLIVCDQAVLDMANHSIEDPLSLFVINNSCSFNCDSIRESVRYWLYPRKNQRDAEIMEQTQTSLRLSNRAGYDGSGRQIQVLDDLENQCCDMSCQSVRFHKKAACLFLPSFSCCRKHSCNECECTCSSSSSAICGGCRGCAMPSMNDRKDVFQIRNNFKPDAAFIGFAQTDENGSITLDFKLTDALTKFKVTAVVNAKEDLIGIGSSAITTNLPIAVRPSLPRFLNYGDLCDLTYILQNQTDSDLTLSLVCQVTNLRIFNGKNKNQRKKGFSVVIPAQGRKEVRIPVQVLKCGKALINIGVRVVRAVAKNPEKQGIADEMVGWSDAVKNDFKIFTPATNEAFATYGDVSETNDNVLQPISLPSKNILAHFGEFSVSTSTTALSTLTDSLIYLYSYPYECNEQIASKLLGIVSMKEMILQFYTPEELKKLMDISGREEIDTFIDTNLARLFERQRYDGAFSYWSNNLIGDPFLTCHVAFCFAKCKSEGYKIPDQILSRTKSILKNISSLFFFGFIWPRSVKDTIKAYAFYILSLLADSETDKEQVISLCEGILDHYNTLTELTQELNPESAAYLAMSIHRCKKEQVEEKKGFFAKFINEKISVYQWLEAIKSYFKENVTIDSGIYAHFITRYEDNELAQMVMLHSNTRTDAVVLGCLMEIDREDSSDIIQKLVRSLLAARNANRYGRWYNTQENSICLISLTDYFKIFEKEVPDMNVNTWLVDSTRPEETFFMGNQSWKGRSREKKITSLPVTAFVPRADINKEVINPDENDSKKSFLLTKNGTGRLYYRIALSYTPQEFTLKSLDRGFSISRVYEAITNPDDVKFDKNTKTWKVKSGELVRVNITICNPTRRYNVALVDKLPAGLEVVNPEIDTQLTNFGNGGNENELANNHYFKWFENQNIRDERVEAFARILYEGTHVYSYICRATTLGSFVAPSTYMEEMYSPECFGRSKTEFVQVYDKK